MEDNNKTNTANLEIIEWIKSIAISIIIATLINTFVFRITRVEGDSMNPTLRERDRLLSVKVSLYFDKPSRGDVVVFKIPNIENRRYIKRIIGIEGDKIEILDGKVYLNDELLIEEYIEKDIFTYTNQENLWLVPKDKAFVLGDNRHEGGSLDSRKFGTIPLDSIKGIANFRFFPFDKTFGKINKTP